MTRVRRVYAMLTREVWPHAAGPRHDETPGQHPSDSVADRRIATHARSGQQSQA